VVRCVAASALALAAAACASPYEGAGALHARKVVLQREVEGLREIVARLERHEPMLPAGDVAIAVDDALVRDIITAQLPFDVDVNRFHLRLTEAEVRFQGSPMVRLRGTLTPRERPGLKAAVNLLGAIEDIEVDRTSSTLRARIAIDHLGIEKAAGVEAFLSSAAVDDLARLIRIQIKDQMPPIQIPVNVQQQIDLPAVTRGPIRIDGAAMPLDVAVSQVVAGRGRLWIAVHIQPGTVVKTADAPPAPDATVSETGVSFAASDEAAARPPAKAPGKGK
jgi:hypothetical protein